MSRRAVTLLIAGIGVCGALLVAAILPVPYVALLPGPTYNTLGRLSGKPVVTVQGHRTYRAAGHLNMVTVSFVGGPGSRPPFTIFAALQAWLSPHEAVVPQSELFPPGQSERQVIKQDTEQMANSQQTATAAALCQLGIPFRTVDTITGTVPGTPAVSVLRRKDVIVAVDGSAVTCSSSAASMIRDRKAGQSVTLTIRRDGAIRKVKIQTVNNHGQPFIGVDVVESFRFPFTVKINIGNVGGPSAGMMFALAIIDKLTPGDLTGGRFIAGTGEISVNGAVGPIGGIAQKMTAARAAGATIFLTPAGNCAEALGAAPPGMRLVKVSTLRGALAALAAIKHGKPAPSCA